MSKPLRIKGYGSIPHLPSSRLGPSDSSVNAGIARMCTERAKQKGDRVIVQEKADGTCVAVAMVGDRLVPLQRKGYPCLSSPHLQHHLFAGWVLANEDKFRALGLRDGWRVVGEWIVQAHGTLYCDPVAPFIGFDIFDENNRRMPCSAVYGALRHVGLKPAHMLHVGAPVAVADVLPEASSYERVSSPRPAQPEGLVYRIERGDETIVIAKWVRPDYEPGVYLPGLGREADAEPTWLVHPWRDAA